MNNLKSVFLALWLVMGVTVNSVAQSAADLYKRANQQYVLFESERDKGTNVNGMYDYLIDSYGKFVDVTKASGNAQYLDGTKNRLRAMYPYLLNAALYYYDQKQPAKALDFAAAYIDIPYMQMFRSELFPKDGRYASVVFFAAVSAYNLQKMDMALKYFKEYINTGAATVDSENSGILSDMECGEGFDRATLDLLGDQEKLIRAIAATEKPLVTVYIVGRPLNMNLASEVSDALLTAWYPGEQGGNGIVDVLTGEYNPSGRLPMSVPRHVGQIPVHYSQGTLRDYMDCPGKPLYTFGYGLSYTTFAYSNLKLSATAKAASQPAGDNEVMQTITCTVTNTGDRDGDEVVQLYLNDEVSSVAVPPIRLKGFQKIFLKKGESREVTFQLTRQDLSIYDRNMNFTAEPGRFNVMIGGSSDNLPLKGSFEIQ